MGFVFCSVFKMIILDSLVSESLARERFLATAAFRFWLLAKRACNDWKADCASASEEALSSLSR
jgi:hypothetical protein